MLGRVPSFGGDEAWPRQIRRGLQRGGELRWGISASFLQLIAVVLERITQYAEVVPSMVQIAS